MNDKVKKIELPQSAEKALQALLEQKRELRLEQKKALKEHVKQPKPTV